MATQNINIRGFYAGRSILITGGTGFIGKVLVEKLLRSFPEIENIYLVVRAKRGKTIEERVNTITNTALFEKLMSLQPEVVQKKLKAVSGDVSEIGLGLSDADRKTLTENVSIIFHGAASVRFDDPLKDAILLNTRGTREIIKLALETKNLKAFLHISTTFCQLDKLNVGEHTYPPLSDWVKTIELAENIDGYILDIFANKYMKNMPNSYTFTKALAENIVYDMCKDKIPAIVLRPSIVISSFNDPMPGWIDNFNGPVGLLAAGGKGILRTTYGDPNVQCDFVQVDIAVRALLLATWQKGITRNIDNLLDVTFYNVSNNNMHSVTTEEMLIMAKQLLWDAPLNTMLWFPNTTVTYYKTWYYINTILFQVIPAIVIDKLLTMMSKKPLLLKIQRRIYMANMALQVFLTNQWSFANDKALGLRDKLTPEEQEQYGYDPFRVDLFHYFKNSLTSGRKYLLKEKDLSPKAARFNVYRMYVLDRFVKLAFYIFMFWILFYKIEIVRHANCIGRQIYEALCTWE